MQSKQNFKEKYIVLSSLGEKGVKLNVVVSIHLRKVEEGNNYNRN